jgi:hypothetical protein
MAWKAVVTGWDLASPNITVGYYDDAEPTNPDGSPVFLYSQTFRRSEITSNADFRAQVIQAGQRFRPVYQRFQALKAAGAITIP